MTPRPASGSEPQQTAGTVPQPSQPPAEDQPGSPGDIAGRSAGRAGYALQLPPWDLEPPTELLNRHRGR